MAATTGKKKMSRTPPRADFSKDGTLIPAGLSGSALGEFWEEFERIGHLLHQQDWIFAKTMAHNPHWYTLRALWDDASDFCWVVDQIRRRGYRKQFGKTWYTQLNVGDHFYWSMGYDVNWPNGTALTILINRKPVIAQEGSPLPLYDALVDRYADLFGDPKEQAATFELVGDTTGLSVLDVGCGIGLASDYLDTAADYLGIDPSPRVLDRMRQNYPPARTICTALSSFVPPDGERYDLLLALHGTGSYLSDDELARIPLLLKPGGRAVVMFYASESVVYTKLKINLPSRSWSEGLFPGAVVQEGQYVTCLYQNT